MAHKNTSRHPHKTHTEYGEYGMVICSARLKNNLPWMRIDKTLSENSFITNSFKVKSLANFWISKRILKKLLKKPIIARSFGDFRREPSPIVSTTPTTLNFVVNTKDTFWKNIGADRRNFRDSRWFKSRARYFGAGCWPKLFKLLSKLCDRHPVDSDRRTWRIKSSNGWRWKICTKRT